jgi:hypothetical protein
MIISRRGADWRGTSSSSTSALPATRRPGGSQDSFLKPGVAAVEQPLRGGVAAVVVVPQRGEQKVDAAARLTSEQVCELVRRLAPLGGIASVGRQVLGFYDLWGEQAGKVCPGGFRAYERSIQERATAFVVSRQ